MADKQKYAGSDWIKSALKVKEMSLLGERVADLLGDVFQGIYHLDISSLQKVEWEDNYYISIIIRRSLSTWDFNRLTVLVVLAHDRLIRVSVSGVGPGYLKLEFHKRKGRDGSPSQRMPYLKIHIENIRRHFDSKPVKEWFDYS